MVEFKLVIMAALISALLLGMRVTANPASGSSSPAPLRSAVPAPPR
ncbi:hypothetical protein ABIG06_000934 [Bradyrhizobium sp. USDA 326]